jgi:hypothetical protein
MKTDMPLLRQMSIPCCLSAVTFEEAKKQMMGDPDYLVISKYQDFSGVTGIKVLVDTTLHEDSWYIFNRFDGVFSKGV